MDEQMTEVPLVDNYNLADTQMKFIGNLINNGALVSPAQLEPSLRLAQIAATLAVVDAINELTDTLKHK